MTEKITVVLVDDHDLVRAGTRQYLERADSIAVVGEAADGFAAQRVIDDLRPCVVLVDIKMPNQGGIDLTRWVRRTLPQTKVIVLSAYDDDPYIMAALEAGANGYVLKNTSPAALIQAVETVIKGGSALDPAITTKVLGLLTSSRQGDEFSAELSDRELEVLQLTARGLTNKEIGNMLHISNRTVQGHLRKIFTKLDVNSRTEAVTKAMALGILDVEYDQP
ncbi:MAG: response regulator transcription factor [Anaerolineae bacterium]|nr:response regulator transcription factor [Anaerolineae bacterium]MCO5194217.1 response regulator transcription factor [Anaerolineae bacterium]MCO5198920.1 response regulator transcription factor [Anaerolineae bacterium]MCO5206002.1 response regulator transcription factor [Anaerolineae bacterium]